MATSTVAAPAEISEKDAKPGITTAPTQSTVATVEEDDGIPIDESTFTPKRVFYILPHHLFTKQTEIIDITDKITSKYEGGDIPDEYRDTARGLSKDKELTANPIYKLNRSNVWTRKSVMTTGKSQGEKNEVAHWKHCVWSVGSAELNFPTASPHSSHEIKIAPNSWVRRTNYWVQDSVQYSWVHDSVWKSNRMTLYKKIGGKKIVVARFAKRVGSWVTGGVLLVDTNEIDEVIAVLTCCVMMRRMQQRASERGGSSSNGGGGGGP